MKGKIHFINAGAGSGKTTELVRIITGLLSSGKDDPSEFILTTYTKAAAGEFRDRTLKALLSGNADARKAAQRLDTATIGTVHSVAMQYLERYWHELGYSGMFSVMSDATKQRHINLSLKKYATADMLKDFHEYCDMFGVKKRKGDISIENPDFWKDDVKSIVDKMVSYGIDDSRYDVFRDRSVDLAGKVYTLDYDKSTCAKMTAPISSWLSSSIASAHTAAQLKNVPKWQAVADAITVATSKDLLTDAELDSLKKSVSVIGTLKDTKDDVKALSDYLDACRWNGANGDLAKKCITHVFDIAKAWSRDFAEYKRKNSIVDYSDMEILFLRLLDIDEVKEDIRSSIKYLFVDEFQDSNPIQLEIFKKLAELVSGQTWWVGDPKQAIYGYRGSDSSLMQQVVSMFPTVPESAASRDIIPDPSGTGLSSQRLKESYRSVETLVKLSNSYFEPAFVDLISPTEKIGSGVALDCDRKDGSVGKPIVHWNSSASGADDAYDALATAVADILLGRDPDFPGCYDEDDKDNFRPIREEDIAILTRKGTDCTKIQDALRKHGINVSSPETELMDKAEVRLVLTLLKHINFIDTRLTRAELNKILYDKNLDEVLKEAAAWETDSALSDPEGLRDLRSRSVAEAITELYARMDLYSLVAKWGCARARAKNLDRILVVAKEYETSCALSCEGATIGGFIRFFKDYEFESELDKSDEGVKVATYHKSKGLQWPVVILDSLDSDALSLPDKEQKSGFLTRNWFTTDVHGTFGSAELTYLPSTFRINGIMADHIRSIAAKGGDCGLLDRRFGKIQAEQTRLMYVGLTRARDYAVTFTRKSGLSWLSDITDPEPKRGNPSARKMPDAAKANPGDECDAVWNAYVNPGKVSSKEVEADEKVVVSPTASPAYVLSPAKDFRPNSHPARVQPSKAESNATRYAYAIDPLKAEDVSGYIAHGTVADNAAFGTCIHDFFAVFRWNGAEGRAALRETNVANAKRVVSKHGMSDVITNPDQLVDAAEAFHAWLERKYGKPAEILRECPFVYHHADGQTASGEMDLVWVLPDKDGKKRCVLADYKNFSAPEDFGKKAVLNEKDADRYAGHHAPQLGEYRAALMEEGYEVIACIIYYSVLGMTIQLDFI